MSHYFIFSTYRITSKMPEVTELSEWRAHLFANYNFSTYLKTDKNNCWQFGYILFAYLCVVLTLPLKLSQQ